MLEPQRSDLWQLDMREPITEFESGGPLFGLSSTGRFYATRVDLPSMELSPEIHFRDSRPYYNPGDDRPPGSVAVSFVHDINYTQAATESEVRNSRIYAFLLFWFNRVRSGRGGMVSSHPTPVLDAFYRVPKFKFDLRLMFLKGYNLFDPAGRPVTDISIDNSGEERAVESASGDSLFGDLGASLEQSSLYLLKNAWIHSLKLGSVDMSRAEVHTIETLFCCEAVVPYSQIADESYIIG